MGRIVVLWYSLILENAGGRALGGESGLDVGADSESLLEGEVARRGSKVNELLLSSFLLPPPSFAAFERDRSSRVTHSLGAYTPSPNSFHIFSFFFASSAMSLAISSSEVP